MSVLTLGACSDNYLDTHSDNVEKRLILSNTANIAMAVNGLSKMMSTQYLSEQGFNGEGTILTYYGNYHGNDFQKCNLTGWARLTNLDFAENSTSLYDYYPWYYYYKILGNANAIINNVDAATGTVAEKQFLKAQALTFRAYCFFRLSQLYSKRWTDSNNGSSRGVVLRLDESTGNMTASTLAETYARIYADLDEALANYSSSGKNRAKGENYAVNADVAHAIYARAALTREDWQTAADHAAAVRTKYNLMTNADYVDGGFNKPNREWIWSVFSSEQEQLYFYAFFAHQASNSNATLARNYPCAMSKQLYDSIPATDVRRAMYLNPDTMPFNRATGRAADSLYAYAFRTYGTKLFSTSLIYAYMQFKMQRVANPGVGEIPLFRSAEMYLTEAEANCHLGKDAEAQALLVALNRTSGRDTAYTCTKTGAELLSEVRLYRRIELWGEGFDWFDYKRWNLPIVRKTFAQGGSFHSRFAFTIQPNEKNNWTWVIPNRETDYNKLIISNKENKLVDTHFGLTEGLNSPICRNPREAFRVGDDL